MYWEKAWEKAHNDGNGGWKSDIFFQMKILFVIGFFDLFKCPLGKKK